MKGFIHLTGKPTPLKNGRRYTPHLTRQWSKDYAVTGHRKPSIAEVMSQSELRKAK